MTYSIETDPMSWLEAELEKKYEKIKGLVYEDEEQLLSHLKNQIEDAHKRQDIDTVKRMIMMYLALFEIAEQDYRDNVGVKYQLESIHLIQRALANRETWFDTSERCIKYPQGIIVCLRLPSGTCVDLCFGEYEKIKSMITSNYYILFGRTDITDYYIFYTVQSYINGANGNFTGAVAKSLIGGGIMYVNKN